MNSYTATFGRNITAAHPTLAHTAMPLLEWEQFRADVAEAFRVTIEKTRTTDGYGWAEDAEFRIEVHYGKGTWNGIEEESAKISVLSDEPLTHLAWLRQELTALARQYGQDAIALTIGESELC